MEKRPPLPFSLLKEMFRKKGVPEIEYGELLWTEEWLQFRQTIKERDEFTCTDCGVSQYQNLSPEEFEQSKIDSGDGKYLNLLTGEYDDAPGEFSLKKKGELPPDTRFDKTVKLEVHHKYYIWNMLPWEYATHVLTTLCNGCHEKVHFTEKREVYADGSLNTKMDLDSCPRCAGRGYFREYAHVQGGRCFQCGGLGGVQRGRPSNSFFLKS